MGGARRPADHANFKRVRLTVDDQSRRETDSFCSATRHSAAPCTEHHDTFLGSQLLDALLGGFDHFRILIVFNDPLQ